MPYRLSLQDDLIRLELYDTFSREDFYAIIAEIEAIEEAATRTPNRIIDVTATVGGIPAFADFLDVSTRRRSASLKNPIRSGVVARDAVHYGYARMFQSLINHPQIEVRIFGSEAEALDWLVGPGPAAGDQSPSA
jgi:hypothetical protein